MKAGNKWKLGISCGKIFKLFAFIYQKYNLCHVYSRHNHRLLIKRTILLGHDWLQTAAILKKLISKRCTPFNFKCIKITIFDVYGSSNIRTAIFQIIEKHWCFKLIIQVCRYREMWLWQKIDKTSSVISFKRVVWRYKMSLVCRFIDLRFQFSCCLNKREIIIIE